MLVQAWLLGKTACNKRPYKSTSFEEGILWTSSSWRNLEETELVLLSLCTLSSQNWQIPRVRRKENHAGQFSEHTGACRKALSSLLQASPHKSKCWQWSVVHFDWVCEKERLRSLFLCSHLGSIAYGESGKSFGNSLVSVLWRLVWHMEERNWCHFLIYSFLKMGVPLQWLRPARL